MRKQGYGRIVNVSSVTGPLVSNIGSSAYGAAKAGIDGMMRAVALETAKSGITINGVAPGWIATGSSTDSEREAAKYTPVGRRSEEHMSELQSPCNLVCRLLLEKKKKMCELSALGAEIPNRKTILSQLLF